MNRPMSLLAVSEADLYRRFNRWDRPGSNPGLLINVVLANEMVTKVATCTFRIQDTRLEQVHKNPVSWVAYNRGFSGRWRDLVKTSDAALTEVWKSHNILLDRQTRRQELTNLKLNVCGRFCTMNGCGRLLEREYVRINKTEACTGNDWIFPREER